MNLAPNPPLDASSAVPSNRKKPRLPVRVILRSGLSRKESSSDGLVTWTQRLSQTQDMKQNDTVYAYTASVAIIKEATISVRSVGSACTEVNV